MNAIIDGIIFQSQGHGGVSRLYREILPQMGDLDDELSTTIITAGRCRQPLPVHPSIKHCRLFPIDDLLRPHRLWRPILDPAREALQRLGLRGLRGDLWHSTHYAWLRSWEKPTVVTVYDMIHERFAHLFNKKYHESFRRQKEHCIRSADAVICISEATKKDMLSFYRMDDSKVTVVPLAASQVFKKLDKTDEVFPGLANRPFIVYVGGRSLHKNFREVLEAYRSWEYRKDIHLAVVGPRWSPEEKTRLTEYGVSDQVHLFTDIDDLTLCRLYNRALALVWPSLCEGFGIPLLEAMACGCPVIASLIPTTLEVMGERAVYYDAGRAVDLIRALNTVRHEGRDSARSKEGLEIAKQYSWKKTARLTLSVYQRLMDGRQA